MNRRYMVTMCHYVWAEDDADAIRQARQEMYRMNQLEDNQPTVLKIEEHPHGSLDVYPVPMTTLEMIP